VPKEDPIDVIMNTCCLCWFLGQLDYS